MGIRGGSSTKAGEVSFFAGDTAPIGWLIANGQLVSRLTFAGLFLAIGTKYGAGDGSTTFAVPNLINRVPVGAGGLYSAGATGGNKDAIVVSHSHGVTDPGHSHVFNSSEFSSGKTPNYAFSGNTFNSANSVVASTTGISVNNTGSSGTDANMPPYMGLTPCIKT